MTVCDLARGWAAPGSQGHTGATGCECFRGRTAWCVPGPRRLAPWGARQVASVMFGSLQPCGLSPSRLLCPWDSPSKNTGVGCHALLQRIFLTQGWNPCLLRLLRWLMGSFPLVPPGKPSTVGGQSKQMEIGDQVSNTVILWINNVTQ